MEKAVASPGACAFALDLPCGIDAVEKARAGLEVNFAQLDLDSRVVNRIEVVLEELVSNVARHSGEATVIRMEAEANSAEIRLIISDDGAPFDPLKQDDPQAFKDVDSARLGGLGIPLVKRLTKSACYQRVDTRNVVSVTFART